MFRSHKQTYKTNTLSRLHNKIILQKPNIINAKLDGNDYGETRMCTQTDACAKKNWCINMPQIRTE